MAGKRKASDASVNGAQPRGKRQQVEKQYKASARAATTPRAVTRSMTAAARRAREQQSAQASPGPSVNYTPSIPGGWPSSPISECLLPASSTLSSNPQSVSSPPAPSSPPQAPVTSDETTVHPTPPVPASSKMSNPDGKFTVPLLTPSPTPVHQDDKDLDAPGEIIKEDPDMDEVPLDEIPQYGPFLTSPGGVVFRDPFFDAAAPRGVEDQGRRHRGSGPVSPRTVLAGDSPHPRVANHPVSEHDFLRHDRRVWTEHHDEDGCDELLPSVELPGFHYHKGHSEERPTLPWVGDLLPAGGGYTTTYTTHLRPGGLAQLLPDTSVYPAILPAPHFAHDNGYDYAADDVPAAPPAFMGRYTTSPLPPWRGHGPAETANFPGAEETFWHLVNYPNEDYEVMPDELPLEQPWLPSGAQFPTDGRWELSEDFQDEMW